MGKQAPFAPQGLIDSEHGSTAWHLEPTKPCLHTHTGALFDISQFPLLPQKVGVHTCWAYFFVISKSSKFRISFSRINFTKSLPSILTTMTSKVNKTLFVTSIVRILVKFCFKVNFKISQIFVFFYFLNKNFL
jgi:hypothetical protein